MKAAYGSSWRPEHEGVEGKGAQHRMPPLLRLNSTGEVSTGVEKPPTVMGQHRTSRTANNTSKSFLGNVASYIMPPHGGRTEQRFVDIHTAVGGITSIEEHLFGTKTMAGNVTKREMLPAGYQQIKMSHPSASASRPLPSRYDRWSVNGLSPWMQPGVFPCHVFSAVQLGVPLQQISPSFWTGQSKAQASVSDSVLNFHVGQFPAPVPFNISICKGRHMHSSPDKPTGSPSQTRAAVTERGHCSGVAKHQHQDSTEHSTSQCKIMETATSSHSEHSQGKHSANAHPLCCNSESEVCKFGGCLSCNCKTAENQPCSESVIPNSCDTITSVATGNVNTAHTSVSEVMPNVQPPNIHHQLSMGCDASVHSSSECSFDEGAQCEEEGPGSAEGQAKATMDVPGCYKGAAGLPSQSDSAATDESYLAGDAQSSISPSTSTTDPANSSSCSDSDTGDFGASGVKFDEHEDASLKSDFSTAASGQVNDHSVRQHNVGSMSVLTSSPIKADFVQTQTVLQDDLHPVPAAHKEGSSVDDEFIGDVYSDVDWDTEDEDDEDAVPVDDFLLELSFPVLSNFLPGQSSQPKPSTASSSAVNERECAARCVVGKMIDTFEVLFFGQEEENLSHDADEVDGFHNTCEVVGRDASQPEHSIPCPVAANARWDLHYPSSVPEKTDAKVTFHCGKGVDQCHEIEQVEVEADEEDIGSEMTFMERQKLMDQRKGHPLSRKDSIDSDADI